jgi:hypothetical protein
MTIKTSNEEFSPAETKQRMEDALRRALNTPPKTHSEMVGKQKAKPPQDPKPKPPKPK